MGYCDYTDEWLRELTRLRRREAAERRSLARPTLRFSIETAIERQEREKAERIRQTLMAIKRPKPTGSLVNNITVKTFRTLWSIQSGCCYLCGNPFTEDNWSTEDHVVPKSKGGANSGNILLAHSGCNLAKADRPPSACEALYLSATTLLFPAAFAEVEKAEAA